MEQMPVKEDESDLELEYNQLQAKIDENNRKIRQLKLEISEDQARLRIAFDWSRTQQGNLCMFAGDYSIVSITDGKISIDLDEKCWKILELSTHEET